jgi:hypothetical protein
MENTVDHQKSHASLKRVGKGRREAIQRHPDELKRYLSLPIEEAVNIAPVVFYGFSSLC